MISYSTMFFVGLLFAFSGKDMPKKFEDIFGPILSLELCLDVLFFVLCAIVGGVFEDKIEVSEFFGWCFITFPPFIISVFITFKNADEKR